MRFSQGDPARKHGGEYAILERHVMVERGERMESREPENRIAEPGVDRRDRRARIVRSSEQGSNLHAREERQWMSFEPRTGDGGEREREQEQVERPLHGLRRDGHPARSFPRGRPRVKHPPQYAHHGKREHAQSQGLVELPVEIAGRRIHALLGPSRSVDERDQDEDRRGPMDELGDSSVACGRAVLHCISLHELKTW